MGTPSSGTRLSTDMLSNASHNMADNYLASNPLKPKGFLEDRIVTAIHDPILQDALPYSLGPKIECLSPSLGLVFN